MAYNNKMTESMLNNSADAFKNMYDIQIRWPGDIDKGNTDELISIRAKGIKIPDFGAATYERHYHGNKINLPKPEQEFDRTVELTFTMDAGFAYYKSFCMWMSSVGDAVTGGVGNWPNLRGELWVNPLKGMFTPIDPDNASNNGSIVDPAYIGNSADIITYKLSDDDKSYTGTVKTKNGANDSYLYWHFGDVWVSKVTAPEFAVDSSDPLEFTVTFQFLDFDAPGYGGLRDTQSDEDAPSLLKDSGGSSGGNA